MLRRTMLMALAASTAAVLAWPAAPSAQGGARSDMEYCNNLADIYTRYVDRGEQAIGRAGGGGDLDGRVAVAKCRAGDTAWAIPTLEKKLRANGFTLPKRN